MPGKRVGVALARDRIYATWPDGESDLSAFFTHELDHFHPGEPWDALRVAMAELRTRLGGRSLALYVAILPPVARSRRVDLPDLPEADLRRILARDTSRFFPRTSSAQRIAIAPGPGTDERPRQSLISIVDEEWAEAVRRAVEQSGCRIATMVPAYAAWAALAPKLWPAAAKGRFDVLAVQGARVHAVHLDHGSVVLTRGSSIGDGVDDQVADLTAGREHIPTGVLAPDSELDDYEELLKERGVTLARSVSEGRPGARSIEAAAAMGALRTTGARLLSAAEFGAGERRRRTTSYALLVATMLLLLVAGYLHRLGLEAELDRIHQRRTAIREQVQRVVASREATAVLSEQISALDAAARGAPRWSVVLAELAPHIPADAHLVGFRGEGDRVEVEGVGADALKAIRSIAMAPGITAVTSEGPVQRGADANGFLIERFGVSARVEKQGLQRRESEP